MRHAIVQRDHIYGDVKNSVADVLGTIRRARKRMGGGK